MNVAQDIEAADAGPASQAPFDAEVDRLRRAGVPGNAGRLRDLFDFLAGRGPDAASATQAEISAAVFGEAMHEADDATVRVYVHRLRRRLEGHYARAEDSAARLTIPAGIYALRLADIDAAGEARPPGPLAWAATYRGLGRWWPVAALLALVAGFAGGWALAPHPSPPSNAVWSPFFASTRPVLVVLGDYYIYGEIDPRESRRGPPDPRLPGQLAERPPAHAGP